MDFKQRLQRATERGQYAREELARRAAQAEISEEEWKRLHSDYRMTLTDHIESCLKQLAENFPGFSYETVVDEKGWGGSITRDDLRLHSGRRDNLFSRFTITVSPHNDYHVLEIIAKGTVFNKENFNRNHYQLLKEVDLENFLQLIERWTLDYAETYAAAS